MAFLVGAQLMVYWVLMRILEELSQREARTTADLKVDESMEVSRTPRPSAPAPVEA